MHPIAIVFRLALSSACILGAGGLMAYHVCMHNTIQPGLPMLALLCLVACFAAPPAEHVHEMMQRVQEHKRNK